MKPYSQMMPRVRQERLLAYNKRIRGTEESMRVLQEWELDLERQLVQFEGHRLRPETLIFGQDRPHM